ncbi:MAG: hypothetical protein HOG49_36995, partial [Candidatus Scalindua sp.]|nr:hypothetical protein [Candidatus Scalindua sp.]
DINKLKTSNWGETLLKIAKYDNLKIKINHRRHLITIEPLIQHQFHFDYLSDKEIKHFISYGRKTFPEMVLYQDHNHVIIEGTQNDLDILTTKVEEIEERISKRNNNYILTIAKCDSNENNSTLKGLVESTQMEKCAIVDIKREKIEDPKINQHFSLSIDKMALSIIFKYNHVLFNGVKITHEKLPFYNYLLGNHIIAIKKLHLL